MISNILASIGTGILMFLNLLGLSVSPMPNQSVTVDQQAASSSAKSNYAATSSSRTIGSSITQANIVCPSAPSNAIVSFQIRNNDLYINCKLAQQNIPGILGMQPSTNGQYSDPNYSSEGLITEMNSYSFSSVASTSADLYVSATTSPQKDLVTIIYKRAVSTPSVGGGSYPFASLLTFSQKGLISRFDLMSSNPAIAKFPKDYKGQHGFEYGAVVQGDLLGIDTVVYVDGQKMYFANKSLSDAPVYTYYELTGSSIKFVAGTRDGEMMSPDGTKMAYVPENDPYISKIDENGDSNTSEIDIADFKAGSNYPVTHDRTKPYHIFGWTKDSNTLMAEVGVASQSGTELDHYTNFFTYNLVSGKTTLNTQSDWQGAMSALCATSAYEECNDAAYLDSVGTQG